jgi:predicted dehydrogenase/threonine dehydrogenase-like Zn-dependent dehydrogenase
MRWYCMTREVLPVEMGAEPMQQLTQKLKNGAMQVLDVPVPALLPGTVLVRNHFSLISAGTEGSTVKAARMGLLEKVKARPDQARQVLATLKTQGIVQTWRAVMKKLDAHSPLGYSSAGEVVEVAADVRDLAVGDLVACAGLTACHAEYVTVPRNLCVKLRQDADLRQAAYNTLGAIAMQGVRQADLRTGETCAVIGLGLLGQLTALILRASAIRVVGIDIDSAMVSSARDHCLDLGIVRNDSGIDGAIERFTDGIGCDAVIITAATSSLDPVNFAGRIARKRGTVVVVGAVPTGFDRDPHFYRKELQLRMSCSYGPGRYDALYEEQGIDYPVGYVRWTENRNMQAFQELLGSGRIDAGYLTTHQYCLEEAPAAYSLLLERTEPFIGILLSYATSGPQRSGRGRLAVSEPTPRIRPARVAIGFIGAGSYAQSHLLPNIPKDQDVQLTGVMTASGSGARSAAERFGFKFCCCDEGEIFGSDEINTVFIASRHDSHGRYVLQALQAGKHVFVEKPLCLTMDELAGIEAFCTLPTGCGGPRPQLMVGFNRRFAPLARELKRELGNGVMAMHYRVNAGHIPADSWIQDPLTGGGRIIGEACHFIDFLAHMNGSLPVTIHAAALKTPSALHDTVTMTLTFRNGSIGTVSYFATGDKSLPKERVEVFADGTVAVLDDFRILTVHAGGKRREKKLAVQDKGQRAEVRAFIEAVRDAAEPPIPLADIFAVTEAAFAAVESIRTGAVVHLGGTCCND